MELCGASLLAELLASTSKALSIDHSKLVAWTDSTIVLGWLRRHPSKSKIFVANRIVEIHKVLNMNQWHHVISKENPADAASRGIPGSQLKSNELWWTGPNWLNKSENSWPTEPEIVDNEIEIKTQKKTAMTYYSMANDDLLNRYSSLNKLLRITAIIIKFKTNCLKPMSIKHRLRGYKPSVNTVEITTIEIQNANTRWIKISQELYHAEIKALSAGLPVNRKSNLLPLNPKLDDKGILRVGGRLSNLVSLTDAERYPIILPAKNRFTTLLIDDAHIRNLHGGIQSTLALLRRKYWIINGRNEVKTHIHNCVICRKQSPKTHTQIMGNLPAHRIEETVPFVHTGVDYAGPINLRTSKGRGIKTYKGYIALFVCMATKAAHLEIVSDLTTEAFIAAFNRFASRRNTPQHMYSDNGSNFVGADRYLQTIIKNSVRNGQISRALSIQNVQWHFNPPGAPHHGGLWERLVRSTKYHLKRILIDRTLTFEELYTVLVQIEATLNSRPLSSLTDNSDDLNPLTPAHFLVGKALISPPQDNLTMTNINCLTRWRLLTKLNQEFWQRFNTEYLCELQRRTKWTTEEVEPQIGDLVLVKGENEMIMRWTLGRIIEKYPGRDGKTRVVLVKTQNSTLKRPINKISSLPISQNTTQSYKALSNKTAKDNK